MNSIKHHWWIFIGAGLMILLVNIDSTIVNLALAKIAADLGSTLSQIQWVVNIYLLAGLLLFIFSGKMADNYGFKIIFLIGTVFFGLSSLIAGISSTMPLLLIGRLFQGVGFAFTLSIAIIMVTNAFPATQRGMILGLLVTIAGLGQALGPTVGGAILTEFNWHWIFLINVPIAVLSFIIILLFGDSKEGRDIKQKIDFMGLLILAITLTIFFITINRMMKHSGSDLAIIIWFGVSILFFAGFVVKEFFTKEPLFDFKLLKVKNYWLSLVNRFCFMYVFGAFLFFIPLYLQNILGMDPLVAGLMILAFSAFFGICAPMGGIWADVAGYRIPIIISALASLMAVSFLAALSSTSNIYQLLLAFMVFGFAAGLNIPCTVNSTMNSLPHENVGEGLGMFFTTAFLGTTLGVAVSSVVMSHVSWSVMQQNLSALNFHLAAPQLDPLRQAANGTQLLGHFAIFNPTVINTLQPLVQTSFLAGFNCIMKINATLSIVMFIAAYALTKKKR